MPVDVFPWPPVAAVGTEWTEVQALRVLRSALTGRSIKTASRPPRRLATVVVTSIGSRNRSGAGYCEMLKRALRGGMHAVRLRSSPINWWMDRLCLEAEGFTQADMLEWQTPGDAGGDLDWTTPGDAGDELLWITGGTEFSTGTIVPTVRGSNITIQGLPPNRLMFRAGDFVEVVDFTNPSNIERRQVVSDAFARANGTTQLRVTPAVTITDGFLRLGAVDEGVFEVLGALPRAVQNVQGDWTYTWNFREIFEDEVGGFTERPGYWGVDHGPA